MLRMHGRCGALFALGLLALVLPAAALADPPANDNRASPEGIAAFPAALHGTTVGATVERLDPQTGRCGAVESTVWYRVDQAPDGLIKISAAGSAFAPALRVFRVGRSSISEIGCANAAAGAAATVSFQSVRGGSFLVLVGKRPATADAEFDLQASVFLPPANDHRGGAFGVVKLSTTKTGSTVGATMDDDDSGACGVASSTVWYRFTSPRDGRVAIRLAAAGNLDTSLVVLKQVRSKTQVVGCARTGSNGRAVATFDVQRKVHYLFEVGQQQGSPQGGFSFQMIAAQVRETVASKVLPAAGVHGTVHGLADVNDLYAVTLQAGTTYRFAFRSGEPCAVVSMYSPRHQRVLGIDCSGYRTFTPGPDGGGRYVVDIEAAPDARTQPYTLRVAAATADDIGIGIPLENRVPRHGSLSPRGIDVVDLYHFDVPRLSDVQLRLGQQPASAFRLELLTDTGIRLASASTGAVSRRLTTGRYVVAVQASPGASGSRYTLALLIRDLTSTTLTIGGTTTATLPLGQTLNLLATTAPTAAGDEELQIDRFDALTGWQFVRLIHASAPSASFAWTPPAAGRWRARVTYHGSTTSSPSRSGYVFVVVA